MTDKIEPALTADQWRLWNKDRKAWADDLAGSFFSDTVGADAAECAENIAYNNAALPDGDPRKITRETVEQIRTAARSVPTGYSRLSRIADALESYLPPETP